MNTVKAWKCGVCGALIDQESGETHVGKNSNAFKFKSAQEEISGLKEDMKKLFDQNERLKEGIKDESDNGNDGSGSKNGEISGSGDGEGSDAVDGGGILDDII